MSYKIIITKLETKTVTREGTFTVIEERPWTEKELIDASPRYGDANDFLVKNPLKQVRGYTPSFQGTEIKEVEVLKQTVDDLDIVAVIKAINKIPE